MTTIDFKRMRWLIRKAGVVYNRWKQAEADACAIGSPIISDMPKGHTVSNPVERNVLKIEQIYDAYREVVDELQTMRVALTPLIDALADPDDKAIMRLRYLDGFSPEVIANDQKFPLSRAAVYNHLYHAERAINRMANVD